MLSGTQVQSLQLVKAGRAVEIMVMVLYLEELMKPEILSDPMILLSCTNATKYAAGTFLAVLLLCNYLKCLDLSATLNHRLRSKEKVVIQMSCEEETLK